MLVASLSVDGVIDLDFYIFCDICFELMAGKGSKRVGLPRGVKMDLHYDVINTVGLASRTNNKKKE